MHGFAALHPCPVWGLYTLVSEDCHAIHECRRMSAVHLSRGVSGRLGGARNALSRAATPRLTAGRAALLTPSSLFAPTTPLRAGVVHLILLLLLLLLQQQQLLLIRPVELLVFVLMRRNRHGSLLLAAVAAVGGVRLHVGRIPHERTRRVVLLHLALLQAELEVLVVQSTGTHKHLRLVRARVFGRCRHHHRDRSCASGLRRRGVKHRFLSYIDALAACRFKQAGVQRASRLLLLCLLKRDKKAAGIPSPAVKRGTRICRQTVLRT